MFLNEDLESDLVDQQKKIDEITDYLIALFDEEDFDKKITPNGISFQKRYKTIFSNFYVDEKLNYKCYITNDENNVSNYSSKGNIDNVENAAENFIMMFLDFKKIYN